MEFNNNENREHSILSLRQIDNKNKGIQIDVEHLSYSVQTGHNKSLKKILEDVSFKMIPGSLTALMGPSGAGKSTLLDLLADRKLIGEWSGNVYFNNGARSKFFDRDSAYILQDDLQIATLTVRETIFFAASFKLPEGTTKEDVNKRVDLLLELMTLTHIQDSFVGDATHRGISGGQLKRLSIAVEMVALPFIVFLDEPTSGLDSCMALDVMQTVRRLAEENRTCIATIHQPSPEVFELFDYVVLLSEGRLIYFGLVSQIQEYFCNQVLSYSFEEGTNPAEFIIEISEGLLLPTDRNTPLTAIEMERVFNHSPYKYLPELSNQKERISVADEENNTLKNNKPAVEESLYSRLHATTKWTQFQLLMYRNFIAILRDKDETIAHFAKNFCVGLTFGIIFYNQANISKPIFDSSGLPTNDVSNVSSLLFISLMFIMMSNIQAIPHLLSRNLIFKREIASFAYAVSPYWLSHSISIIPMQFLGFLLFTITCFFLNGYPITGSYFFYFFFVIFLAGLSTYYYAMLLAALIPQENVALGVFSIMFLFFSTFVGYSISITDIPTFWTWAPYVDYARWAFEGLMVNQWEDYDDDGTSGQTVLEMYDFDGYDKNHTFWILLLVCVIFMIAVYIALRPPVKQLKKVPYLPSLSTTISPLLDDNKRNASGLKDNLLSEEDKRDIESFAAITPRFKDGVSVNNSIGGGNSIMRSNNNSIVDAPKVPTTKGYNLTFSNLSYSLDTSDTTASSTNGNKGALTQKEPLKLLQNVTGRVESTEMLALMGSSGAGKSTLLDVLANRKTIGTITGDIYINGHIRTPELMQSTAYVMQDSAHLGFLTVKETLQFAANFRMAQHEPQELKDERVNDLLATLRLDHIADSIVGNEETRGISGGQKRRLSIGVEIVHLPKLIFLDEPTTGLDSASANEVISVVRILANQNRTVICTIHQPSAKCFAMFDKVLLLGKGQVIYFGSIEDMKGYFMNCIYQFPYKSGRNVADYMVDIGSGTYASGMGNHEIIDVPPLVEMYTNSTMNHHIITQLPELLVIDKAKYPLISSNKDDKKVMSWYEKTVDNVLSCIPGAKEEFSSSQAFQMKTLLHRLYLERTRNLALAVAPIARGIVTGLLFGSIYYDLGVNSNDPEDYTNRLSLFFFMIMSYLMPHLDDMADLQNERNLFYRERSSRAYSVFSYWSARMSITIIPNLIGCFIYSLLLYYMCGLRDHDNGGGGQYFLYFFFIGFVCDQLSYLFASIISNISSSMQVAASLFPVFVFFMVGFEGFIIYLPNFPDWISWLAFFSFTRYLFQGLVVNEFSGNSDLPLSSTYIHNLGFQSLNTSDISFILLVFGLIMAFVSYVTLYYIRFERR